MKVNPDFDLSKITKYDGISNPYSYDQAEKEYSRSRDLKRKAVIFSKNVVTQTFDDLWDWRLKQGNLLIAEELKNSINMYIPSHTSNKKKHRTENHSRLSFDQSNQHLRKESNLQSEENNDEINEPEKSFDLNKEKDIKDLEKMAGMSEAEIKLKYGRKSQKKTNKAESSIVLDKPNFVNNTDLETFEINKGISTKQYLNQGVPIRKEENTDSFEVSDDEEETNRSKQIMLKVIEFLRFKGARLALKAMIRRKRNRDKKKRGRPDVYNDIRQDEDFNTVGKTQIQLNDFVHHDKGKKHSRILNKVQPKKEEKRQKQTEGNLEQAEDVRIEYFETDQALEPERNASSRYVGESSEVEKEIGQRKIDR